MKLAAKIWSASCAFAIVLFLASSNVGFAQVTASMTGRVEDPSGASVPGANVTVTSRETGAAHTATSNEEGEYQVLQLPVGLYDVKAEKAGFKASIQSGINLVVGQQGVVNLKLEVGAVGEQVTVTADAALVNTTTSQVSGLVGEKQVKELPLNGRSFDLLLTLNAGTINFTANKSAANPGVGGNLFSVTGRRSSENVVLLNGIEYTGAGNAAVSPGGASGELLGIDAVREYNVVSDNYGAEFGKRAGGQVTMVTMSGTNQLHGTLFEFLRNSDLDARDFFAQGGVPPFKRNQFGGAAGGPIKKNKAFIFGNYEGLRQRLGLSLATVGPNVNTMNGKLPCGSAGFPTCAPGTAVGTPTSVPNLDPRMLPYLQDLWPVPNGPDLGGGTAENFSNPANPVRQDFGTTRFDLVLSQKDSFSSAYTIDDSYNLTPSVPFFGLEVDIRNQVLSAQETHIFSPTVVNTFTTGFSRAHYENLENQTSTFPANLSYVTGRPPGTIMLGGNINTSTISQPGNQNPFALFVRNLFTANDSVQVVKGKHQFSFGGWFQKTQDNDNDPLRGNGSASFANYETLLQGTVASFTVASKTVENGWRNWEGAWFVQDSIQLRPNLTVRLGLRHEFAGVWSEVNGLAQTYLYTNGIINTLPQQSNTFNTANNAKWLFSPRVGLAWDPFGNGKTSIRAAGGIYYDMLDWLLYFVDTTPPLNGAVTFTNKSLFSIIPVNNTVPVLPACSATLTPPNCSTFLPKSIQSNYQIPTVISWNLTLEQQLDKSTALRVAYIGSHNYHNWLTGDPDTIPISVCANAAGCLAGGINPTTSIAPQGADYIPATCSTCRPNPYLGSGFFSFTRGYGNYNSLQVEVTRRLARGLQFRANYTFSKSLDIASSIFSQIGGTGGGSANYHINGNIAQDYGLSAFNITHQAGGNISYELPIGKGHAFLGNVHGVADKLASGWQLNSIVTLLSGFPITIAAGGNPSGNGDTNGTDRVNYAPGFSGSVTSGVTAGCGPVQSNGQTLIPAGQQLGTPNRWFNPCDFTLPPSGTFGNVARGVPIGPGLATVNMSLFKNTKITERIGLQFRAEIFNILNHPNFGIPQAGNPLIFTGSSYSSAAGVITSTVPNLEREIQFGLKLNF